MPKIPAALLSAFRGVEGDNATFATMQNNINTIIQISRNQIRPLFPILDLFVPHEQQRDLNANLLHRLWKEGKVSSLDIIIASAKIVAEKDIILIHTPVSAGMRLEIDYASSRQPKVFIYFDTFDDEAKEKLAQAVNEIKDDGNKIQMDV